MGAAVRENRMAGETRRGREDVEETVFRDEARETVLVFGRTRDDDDEKQRGDRRSERGLRVGESGGGDDRRRELVRNCDQERWGDVFYLSEQTGEGAMD